MSNEEKCRMREQEHNRAEAIPETVALDENSGALLIVDQTQLPGNIEVLKLRMQEEIREAIFLLKVRGAPAIGVAAAFGVYLAAREIAGLPSAHANDSNFGAGMESVTREIPISNFLTRLRAAAEFLRAARPTAVNLSWAIDRMLLVAEAHAKQPIPEIVEALKTEARRVKDEDAEVCRRIGEHGLTLLRPGMHLLTHCNAGALATAGSGTATAPIYLGHSRAYDFSVYADETRPLLQGMRLTAFELLARGVDVTLICDNMAASLMAAGRVDAVLVGCDRVAANGDTANKIGTLSLAVNAKHFDVPFYVCAPKSTIDRNCKCGNEIVIEERPHTEVTEMWFTQRMAPAGVKGYNPAFDVTPAELITAIVTEDGVLRTPYEDAISKL